MPERLQTRVVVRADEGTDVLINRRPTCVHWISVSVETLNTQALIEIYDGAAPGGERVWRLEPGYSRHHNFDPNICCQAGCFVVTDAEIASYTIGYCPLSDVPFD